MSFKIVIRNLKYQVVPMNSVESNDIVISHGWDYALLLGICNAANAYINSVPNLTNMRHLLHDD